MQVHRQPLLLRPPHLVCALVKLGKADGNSELAGLQRTCSYLIVMYRGEGGLCIFLRPCACHGLFNASLVIVMP